MLHGACPNPFNGACRILFTLKAPSRVRLDILDLRGRMVERLIDGERPSGTQDAVWDPAGFPAGVYMCVLQAGPGTETCKLLLVK